MSGAAVQNRAGNQAVLNILLCFILPFAVVYNVLRAKKLVNDTDFITYDLVDFIANIFLESDDGGSLAALATDIYWTQDEIGSGDFAKIAPGLIDVI